MNTLNIILRPVLISQNTTSNALRRFKKTQTQRKQPRHYLLMRAAKEDYYCILKLMESYYYPEEPTCSSLAFRPNALFEDHTVRALSEGLSVIAKCKYSGEILGACINESTNPWDPDLKEKMACITTCKKTRHLLHFYAFVQRKPDLWKKLCLQKVFEMSNLVTRRDQRGKGLGFALMQNSRILAADCGYHAVRTDATSFYTAKIAEKLKMKMVYELPYCSYLGSDQQPIFKPQSPHVAVKVYVDENPQESVRGERNQMIDDKPYINKW